MFYVFKISKKFKKIYFLEKKLLNFKKYLAYLTYFICKIHILSIFLKKVRILRIRIVRTFYAKYFTTMLKGT